MGDLIDREAAIAVANAETWEYPQDDADAGNNYAVSRIVEGLRALPSATQAGGENQALRAMIRVNMLRYGPADLTHEDIDRQIGAALSAASTGEESNG